MTESPTTTDPAGTDRVSLPSGGWIELRDPRQLRRGDKNRIMRSVAVDPKTPNAGVAIDMTEGVARILITAWQIPYLPDAPIPATLPAILDELELADSAALDAALVPAVTLLFPKPGSPDQHDDPASPSGPASA